MIWRDIVEKHIQRFAKLRKGFMKPQ